MAQPEAACIDASIFVKVLLPDERDPGVDAAWKSLLQADIPLFAPVLFRWETSNAVLQAVRRGRITKSDALELLGEIVTAPITVMPTGDLLLDAWRNFVLPFDMPAVYDSVYLALAHWLDCEFWTADRRLYRLVREALPWVRMVPPEA